MTQPGESPSIELRLPEIDVPKIRGTRFVRYPLWLATFCLTLLLLLFVAVGLSVRFDVPIESTDTTTGEPADGTGSTGSITAAELIWSSFERGLGGEPTAEEPRP